MKRKRINLGDMVTVRVYHFDHDIRMPASSSICREIPGTVIEIGGNTADAGLFYSVMTNEGQTLNDVPESRVRLLENTSTMPEIKSVKFNGPATIIFWDDGTKTIVKAHDEKIDPEKGIAMAIAKRALGNRGNYFNAIKKWLPNDMQTDLCHRDDRRHTANTEFCSDAEPRKIVEEKEIKNEQI